MDLEVADTEEEEKRVVFEGAYVEVLSRLYSMLCGCRRDYPELEDIIDPAFHLDDCNYRLTLEHIDFKY